MSLLPYLGSFRRTESRLALWRRRLAPTENLEQLRTVLPGESARPFTRVFDLICSGMGLIVLSPLLLLIALAIKVGDDGPIFYRQQRVGKDFRPFGLLKFRTMLVGADKTGLLTAPGDTRITRVGAFLRRYKLDELPQLLNVVKGEMQLVGARPEVPQYVEMFRAQYAVILREPPGITDRASIAYREEHKFLSSGDVERQYVTEILPDKIRMSLRYQAERSFLSDIRLLFETLQGLFSKRSTDG